VRGDATLAAITGTYASADMAGSVPDAQPAAEPEDMKPVEDSLVAGKRWAEIENVSRPTMMVYSPKGRNTGDAVVVFPGGGYKILVARWLRTIGMISE
jgi:hypothetical protein